MILCGTLPCIDACPDRQECIKAMAGLKRICKAHGGMKVTGRDGVTINYDAEGNAMAPKAPTLSRNKTPIGNYEDIKNAAGRTVVKPKVSRKTSVSQKIAQRKSKKITVARKGQRP